MPGLEDFQRVGVQVFMYGGETRVGLQLSSGTLRPCVGKGTDDLLVCLCYHQGGMQLMWVPTRAMRDALVFPRGEGIGGVLVEAITRWNVHQPIGEPLTAITLCTFTEQLRVMRLLAVKWPMVAVYSVYHCNASTVEAIVRDDEFPLVVRVAALSWFTPTDENSRTKQATEAIIAAAHSRNWPQEEGEDQNLAVLATGLLYSFMPDLATNDDEGVVTVESRQPWWERLRAGKAWCDWR